MNKPWPFWLAAGRTPGVSLWKQNILSRKGNPVKRILALNQIQQLYAIEKHIKGKMPEEKLQIRQEKAAPLLDKFKAWLEKSSLQVTPKSKMGDAINYSLNQWHKLTGYAEDGRLNIDNNRAERAIKPFVIGRKN